MFGRQVTESGQNERIHGRAIGQERAHLFAPKKSSSPRLPPP